ncbi:hypothetical protein B0H14DRAFT_2911095 [Mycena olivaceomarginata]|nr:hypothetical protein B0H14DRAFT_2911095 [Mycena olivaceomarginata]
MFVLLTFSRLLVSSEKLCAFPPLPMFVLLTFSCLLVSSSSVLFPHHPSKCVLSPHRPCLSCSLFLAFSSLASLQTDLESGPSSSMGQLLITASFTDRDEGMDPFDCGFG